MLKKIILLVLCTGLALFIVKFISGRVFWDEEVKLNDGRVIVVSRSMRCPGRMYPACFAREEWLTINLPEFSPAPILWHEHLELMILNVDKGQLYLVAKPPYEREYNLYGQPEPFYIGYLWTENHWVRIPFAQIPVAIYDTNLLINNNLGEDSSFISLEKKAGQEFNGAFTLLSRARRIDPTYRSNFTRYSEEQIKAIRDNL